MGEILAGRSGGVDAGRRHRQHGRLDLDGDVRRERGGARRPSVHEFVAKLHEAAGATNREPGRRRSYFM